MRIQMLNHEPDTGQQGSNNNVVAEEVTPPEKLFTQADLDAKIDERLKRQRAAFEAKAREEAAALETKQLEDQKQFEALASKRADEIRALKPRADLADGYEKSVTRLVAEMAKTMPSDIQTLLLKLPLQDQIDWLSENAATAKPATATSTTNINAYTRNSGGAGGMTDEEYLAKKRASGLYM